LNSCDTSYEGGFRLHVRDRSVSAGARRPLTEHDQVERIPRSSHFEKGSGELYRRSYRYGLRSIMVIKLTTCERILTKSRIAGAPPPNCPFPRGSGPPPNGTLSPAAHPSPHYKLHLNRFIRFSTAHKYVQQTDIDHGTSVTIGRIVALCACDAMAVPRWGRGNRPPNRG